MSDAAKADHRCFDCGDALGEGRVMFENPRRRVESTCRACARVRLTREATIERKEASCQ